MEQEKLDLILEAGRNAPTAHNNQPQRIFVFRSPEALEKADACMDCHFHAPVVIAVGYDPKESWHREHDGKDHGEIDASIAVTQMMLQAADLGLGTTYVGMFRPVDLVKTFPEMEGLEMIAMLPLGASRGGRPSRQAPRTAQAHGGTGEVPVTPKKTPRLSRKPRCSFLRWREI